MTNVPPELKIRIGRYFEASAKGCFAISILVLSVFGYLAGTSIGIW